MASKQVFIHSKTAIATFVRHSNKAPNNSIERFKCQRDLRKKVINK